MTLMQIRELIFCPHHNRGFIVLEDAERRLTLAFDVHPDEVPRLARLLKGSRNVVHPLHDFIQSLLDALLTTPTDVILDDVPERGFMAFIHVQRAGTIMSVPCYAPDALALAAQLKTPIYATTRALVHAEPRSAVAQRPSGGRRPPGLAGTGQTDGLPCIRVAIIGDARPLDARVGPVEGRALGPQSLAGGIFFA